MINQIENNDELKSLENIKQKNRDSEEKALAKFPSRDTLLAALNNIGEKNSINEKGYENDDKNITVSEEKFSELEEKALKKGWQPKNKFDGKEENWVNAKEFLFREDFKEKMNFQNKKLEKLENLNLKLTKLLEKQETSKIKNEADQILRLKREAIENQDVNLAETYEKQYYDLQKEFSSPENTAPSPTPEVLSFIERNKDWFNDTTTENQDMKDFAVLVDTKFMQHFPDWTEEKRLQQVEEKIKKTFPHRFENTNRNRPPQVESKSHSIKHTSLVYADMPPYIKEIIDKFCDGKSTKMSKDDYVKKLIKSGAIRLES